MTWLPLAYLLIVAGFLLLFAELLFPSGLLAVGALVCVTVGVVVAFMNGVATGVVTLIAVGVALPVVGSIFLHYWPRSALGKHLFLHGPEEDTTLASSSANQELGQLIGRFGRAVSDLRPA